MTATLLFSPQLLLILDSLGSTELLFILVIALIFFGPRKLPQLSRSLGKSIAEFRKASEDFKRTWEREVELEATQQQTALAPHSIADQPPESGGTQEWTEGGFDAEKIVARQSTISRSDTPYPSQTTETYPSQTTEENLPKRDWL